MDPITIGILAGLILVACGTVVDGKKDGGEDVDGADSGGDVDGGQDVGDGGDDLTKQEGVNDQWAKFDDQVVDLNLVDQKLGVLLNGLNGNPHRLVTCNLASQSLEKTNCEDFVVLREPPLSHHILDDRYWAVIYNTSSENHPGIFIVDRELRRIQSERRLSPQPVQTGQGVIEVRLRSLSDSMLFGGFLLVSAESCVVPVGDVNDPKPECTSWTGTILKFPWNGDGSLSYDWGILDPLFTSDKNPTLFWKKSEDALQILNNGSPTESPWASFDSIELNGNGKPAIDPSKNFFVSELPLEPLKQLTVNPEDPRQVLLARGHDLILVTSGASPLLNPFPWPAEGRIVDIQWHSGSTVFVADSASKVYRLTRPNNGMLNVSNPLTVFGQPTVSALDLSGCVYYLASEESGKSAITAIKCDVLTNL